MRQKRKSRGRAEEAALEAMAADAGVEIVEGEPEPPSRAEPRRAEPGPPPGTTTEVNVSQILEEAELLDEAWAPSPDAAAPPEETDAAAEEPIADAEAVDADLAPADGEVVDDEDGEGDEVAAGPTNAAQLDEARFRSLVEALLFAADKPLTVARLRQLTRVSDTARIQAALDALVAAHADTGIVVSSVSGGYSLRTHSAYSPWVQQLIAGRPVRLSRAQLETLAIVAYRQPITRPEIDQIRGVDSGATLKLLLDRSLIRILGKREEVGRPLLYGTTKEFLDFFSLNDLRELPTLREYSELTEESRGVVARLGLDVATVAASDAVPEPGSVTEPEPEAEAVPEPEPEPEPPVEPDAVIDTSTAEHHVLGSPDPDDAIVDGGDDEAY